jgi:HEAT repeat protein
MYRSKNTTWMSLGCCLLAGAGLAAQEVAKQRVKAVRDLGKGGSEEISRIEPFLTDPDLDVRVEAVKAITDIGTQTSLDPLIKATTDNDAEVQIRATDGLVNFYVPGYVKTGLTAPLRRMGTSIKGRFTETNDQVIDPYIQVRPEVIGALGRLVQAGASMESRANAARATGILRGRQALPELEQALHSKDTPLIYECLIAIQKIRDPSAGASIIFLVHDLDERVQIAAIETTGLLLYRDGINDLRDALDRFKNMKVKRAALTAMAEVPDEQMHGVYIAHLNDKDDGLREGAAEGLARLKNPGDRAVVEMAFSNERKTGPRLSLAFALVSMGKREMGEFDPLHYLLDNLNSAGYKGVARPYLTELARDAEIRKALYPALQDPTVTKDEKIGLAQILARSGDRDSIPALETLSRDPDQEVAQEGLRGLKNLRARLQ